MSLFATALIGAAGEVGHFHSRAHAQCGCRHSHDGQPRRGDGGHCYRFQSAAHVTWISRHVGPMPVHKVYQVYRLSFVSANFQAHFWKRYDESQILTKPSSPSTYKTLSAILASNFRVGSKCCFPLASFLKIRGFR